MKTYLNWSTGKDSALALYQLQQDAQFDVSALLIAVNAHHDRVSMHGLRRSVMEQQVSAVGIPSVTVELPEEPDMVTYESAMRAAVTRLQQDGFQVAAFGDIFLEDLRTYRENKLNEVGMKTCFPIWKRDTRELMKEFINLGFKAKVVCVRSDLLDASFAGREIDLAFIQDLPEVVDPCGENGEFHTFCYDGPIFKAPVKIKLGEKVYKEYSTPKQDNMDNEKRMGFWFCDIFPA